TLKLAGLTLNEQLMLNIPFKQDDADENIQNLLALPDHERPTAIFAGNNFIAANVIKALRHHGLDVPKDMSIVCFDDFEPISNVNPFITAAVQPAYSFGYTGIQFLIERIKKTAPEEYRNIVLSPEVIIRKSTSPIKDTNKKNNDEASTVFP